MRRLVLIALLVSLIFVVGDAYGASQYAHHWTEYSDAPMVYWAIIILLAVILLGYVYWANTSEAAVKEVENPKIYYYFAGVMLGFVLFAGAVYILPLVVQGWGIEPTPGAWDWESGETLTVDGITGEPYKGYRIAIAQGCFQGSCHTMLVRPQDIPTGYVDSTLENVPEPGDYANMRPPLWGTQRNGPDLSNIGKRLPSMTWNIEHLKDPRSVKPLSIMPSYRYLSDKDVKDLSAFLVSLGNDPSTLKKGEPLSPEAEGLSPEAKAGLALATANACSACHSIDGTKSVGPTWKGLYGKEETLQGGATVTVDDDYIRESVQDPNAKIVKDFSPAMPPFSKLRDEEISQIIEYIKTLE